MANNKKERGVNFKIVEEERIISGGFKFRENKKDCVLGYGVSSERVSQICRTMPP